MKSAFLSKVIITFVLCSKLWAGTEINNGGSGIQINGKVATFYSVELQIQPEKFIPNTFEIDQFIYNLPIPAAAKYELNLNIKPSSMRSYYAITSKAVDELTLMKIKNEYSKITKLPVQNIVVFALTDPVTQITLLLPDFFKLNNIEQMAILLHESLWINLMVKNYADMLKIERSAQILAHFPEDCMAIFNFVSDLEIIFGSNYWSLNAAYQCEKINYEFFSKGSPVKVSDYFDAHTMRVISKIILASTFDLPTETLKSELIDALEAESQSRIFKISKNALIARLKLANELTAKIPPFFRHMHADPEDDIVSLLDKDNLFSNKNILLINSLVKKSNMLSPVSRDLDSLEWLLPGVAVFKLQDIQ